MGRLPQNLSSRLRSRLTQEPSIGFILFGSAARGAAGPLSDLDVGLLLRDSLSLEARTKIAAAVGSRVQKLAGPRVDVTVLNDAPP